MKNRTKDRIIGAVAGAVFILTVLAIAIVIAEG